MFLQDAVDNTLDVQPAIDLLASLLPEGLTAIPDRIARPMDRDDYSQSLSMANEYYATHGPSHQTAVLIYTVLLIVRGLTQEAKSIIRKASEHFEGDVTLQVVQAIRLIADDEESAALDLLDGLLSLSVPERLLGLMGDLFLDMEEEEKSIDCYKRASKQVLDSPEIPYRLGHLLYERGEIFDAAASFEHAARVAVDEVQFWILSAQAWVQADEYERAVNSLDRVLRLDDDDEEVWMEYGVLLATTGQLDRARHALERACALDEFAVDSWIQLAHVELELGFFDESLQHYNRAIELDSQAAEAHFGASVVAMEMGDVILAEKSARRSLELDEQNHEHHFHLGIVLVERHKHQEAVEHFEQALDMEEPPPMYQVVYAVSLVALNNIERAFELVNHAWDGEVTLEAQGATVIFVEQLMKQGAFERAVSFLKRTTSSGCRSWQAISQALLALAQSLNSESFEIPSWSADDFSDEELHGMEWDVYPFMNLSRRLGDEARASVTSMLRAIP